MQDVSELSDVSSEIEIPTLNFPLLPTLLITLSAYLISTCFFSVYEMAIDTLFLCFLQDSEINDGSKEKPFYMSKYLFFCKAIHLLSCLMFKETDENIGKEECLRGRKEINVRHQNVRINNQFLNLNRLEPGLCWSVLLASSA